MEGGSEETLNLEWGNMQIIGKWEVGNFFESY